MRHPFPSSEVFIGSKSLKLSSMLSSLSALGRRDFLLPLMVSLDVSSTLPGRIDLMQYQSISSKKIRS